MILELKGTTFLEAKTMNKTQFHCICLWKERNKVASYSARNRYVVWWPYSLMGFQNYASWDIWSMRCSSKYK